MLTLQIPRALRQGELAQALECPQDEAEAILDQRSIEYIPENEIYGHATVSYLWYDDKDHDEPSPPTHKAVLGANILLKYESCHTSSAAEQIEHSHYVRRVLTQDEAEPVALCHTHSIRAELEISVYDRERYATSGIRRSRASYRLCRFRC